MTDVAEQNSPIIRSHKRMSVVPLPVSDSPPEISLSNTLTPTTALRASATVSDMSWNTGLITPPRLEASKRDNNSLSDVFTNTRTDITIPLQSDVDLPFSESDESSSGNMEISGDESKTLSSLADPPPSKVLSTFRNNLFVSAYPKTISPEKVSKSMTLYSTPKIDKLNKTVPDPPASAIVSSPSFHMESISDRKIWDKVMSCKCCMDNFAVRVVSTGTQYESLGEADEAISEDLLQVFGRDDGLTQQLMQETAKRSRPKSVVHFNEQFSNDKAADVSTSGAKAPFKTPRNAFPRKPIDVRNIFNDEENVFQSGSSVSNDGFVGFRKASGATLPKLAVDCKKIFGDDFSDLQNSPAHVIGPKPQLSFAETAKSKPLMGVKQSANNRGKLDVESGVNSEMCESIKANNSVKTSVPFDAKKLFGDDFPLDAPKSGNGGFKSARKSLQLPPAHVTIPTTTNDDAICKARSIFGDDFDAIIKEQPRCSGLSGFQSSRKIIALETRPDLAKSVDQLPDSLNFSNLPEDSDVESVYNEDINQNSPDEDDPEVGETSEIPAEFYLPTQTACYDELATALKEQHQMIEASENRSTSKSCTYGIMWYIRSTDKQKLTGLSSFVPNFGMTATLDAAVLNLVRDPYFKYRFPVNLNENGGPIVKWLTVDGGLLVASPCDGTIGWEELHKCLLTTPGVSGSLIPNGWVENHYRWIVWKLAKEAFAFGGGFLKATKRFNAECVAQQLKYRYDRELDVCQRPCLRRIVEKDSSPKGVTVLCVSRIIRQSKEESKELSTSPNNPTPASIQIELTDGWYAITAHLDPPLQRMVTAGRIFVGCKLVIAGAELAGLEDGVEPLKIPPGVHLRISANSTRLAKKWWAAKLGFSRAKRLCVPIRSLLTGGGNASAIKAVVSRVYPMLYIEKKISSSGTADSISRQEADEAVEAERAKAVQEKAIEDLMQKLAKEDESPEESPVQGAKRRKITVSEIKELCTGEEIAVALKESSDPENVQSMLSLEQIEAFHQYRAGQSERLARRVQMELQKAREEQSNIVRNVTPVLKVFAVGLSPNDRNSEVSAIISVWKVSENARDTLQEGQAYYFHHLTVSRPVSNGASHLNGCHITSWLPVSNVPLLEEIYVKRKYIPLADISEDYARSKVASYTNREIDVVGVCLRHCNETNGMKKLFFVDEHGDMAAIQGNAIAFTTFINGECCRQTEPFVFVASNVRINANQSAAGAFQPHTSGIISLFAQDYSTFASIPVNAAVIPPRIANHYRFMEDAIKSAISNRKSLVESGLAKLETVPKLSPMTDDLMRSISRNDARCSIEAGPQRPGSSTAKTPATTQMARIEIQKRKAEKLDKILSSADSTLIFEPSPLPAESTKSRSRSVLKRPFKTPKVSKSPDT